MHHQQALGTTREPGESDRLRQLPGASQLSSLPQIGQMSHVTRTAIAGVSEGSKGNAKNRLKEWKHEMKEAKRQKQAAREGLERLLKSIQNDHFSLLRQDKGTKQTLLSDEVLRNFHMLISGYVHQIMQTIHELPKDHETEAKILTQLRSIPRQLRRYPSDEIIMADYIAAIESAVREAANGHKSTHDSTSIS